MDRRLDHERLEQALHCGTAAEPTLHALVEHALVRGVGVDQHQSRFALREDVDAVQLRHRDAERSGAHAHPWRRLGRAVADCGDA
jgi:hypothetical protein